MSRRGNGEGSLKHDVKIEDGFGAVSLMIVIRKVFYS